MIVRIYVYWYVVHHPLDNHVKDVTPLYYHTCTCHFVDARTKEKK